ncbi:MAG: tetratricopeptide repeat protein [Pseudomonadales bacterium]|nr:tetratricopeptide repeat protein [Pseudomonadales bacterium]
MPVLLISLLGWLAGCGEQRVPAGQAEAQVAQAYVGSSTCAECHAQEYDLWFGSHHQLAMQPASSKTVVADFDGAQFTYAGIRSSFTHDASGYQVRTEGASGELADHTVRYTFGVAPLQQYLLEGANGRLQALGISWDSRSEEQGGGRWFHLHPDESVGPDDVLHWTKPAANWNFMCADCHSTGLQKNYDAGTRSYETKFAEVSVGCEACHGQSSQHVSWARSGGVDPDSTKVVPMTSQQEQMNTCAQCHSRRGQLTDGFTSKQNFFDYYLPVLLDEGLYHADGQILDEVYVYGSFTQSKMHEQGVTCSNCHEPHSNQIKIAGNGLCTQCHNSVGRPDFPSLSLANYDSSGHHFHEQTQSEPSCVSCHMSDKTYMVVDDRRDHSFRIPRPDLSVSLQTPNACNQCHEDKTPQWAASAIEDWYPGERDDHFASIFAAGRNADPAVEPQLTKIAMDSSQPAIVRATALSLLVSYELHGSSVAIEKGLRDTSALVRVGALRGAQRWPAEQRWQRTKRLLDDERLAVRVEAVRGLVSTLPELGEVEREAFRPYLDDYLRSVTFNADVAEGQSELASVHLALNDIPAAEQALKTSLELNPQWVPGLINLADLYRSTGRDGQGGPLLEQAHVLAPEVPDVLLSKALWVVRQGEAATALPLLEQAWQLAPESARYAYVHAVALHSAGRSSDALAVVDRTLALRRDRQLLQAAYSIAQEANLEEKAQEYGEALQVR